MSPWQPALLQCRLDPWVKPCWLPGLLKGLCWWKCYCRYSLKNKKKACYCYKDGFPFRGNVKHFSFGGQPILCLLQGQQQHCRWLSGCKPGTGNPLSFISGHTRRAGGCVHAYLFIFPQETHVSRNIHILNICLLAGPQHRSALAEETGNDQTLVFSFLHF